MSGYENAPATRMLATHCAACGRALVDSVSVEKGMGPDCREKYGRGREGLSPEAQVEANRLVYQIALGNSAHDGAVRRDRARLTVAQAAEQLKALGFELLAQRVLERACAVQVIDDGARFGVKAPYREDVVARFRRIMGRKWDGEKKVSWFPVSRKVEVWSALQALFPGEVGYGPRGVFQIGGAS